LAVNRMKRFASSLIVLAGLALPVIAQPATPAPASPAPAAAAPAAPVGPEAPWAPKWSDPALEKVGAMLVGSWKTEGEVAQSNDPSKKVAVAMHISPVVISDLTDTLYVEASRLDAQHRPYRQAIFQLYKFKDKIRLRTLEFHKSPGLGPAIVGLWASPETFPKFSRTDLIATLDLELAPSADGYTAKTPYPYPTAAGGAVEMTSELSISKDALISADRGYGADGKVVWGSSETDRYTFKRFDSGLKWTKLSGGLLSMDFAAAKSTDKVVASNDSITVHYSGWLFSNGAPFDSSRDRGQPASFQIGTVIPGWNEGMLGAGVGTIRRLVIPAEMGYGSRGAGRVIPPNAALSFEVEVHDVQKAPPPATPLPQGPEPAAKDSPAPASAPTEVKPK